MSHHRPAAAARQVRVAMEKWGDRRHWTMDVWLVGSDEVGDWLFVPAGTRMHRPGAEYVAPTDQVLLVPTTGDSAARAWVATFHTPAGPLDTYVDITTPPRWDGDVLRCVDLDLDVIREHDGRCWIDDEDEFAEHQVSLGYPAEVIDLARASADRLLAEVRDRTAPFDGRQHRWFTVGERLVRG